MTVRVLFYSQHLLGVGHDRRSGLIAAAMTEAGLDVTLVRGGFADAPFAHGAATVVQLPPVRAADASFGRLLDADGRAVDAAWEGRRRAALLRAFAEMRPDIVILEGFPFARRRFRFELLALLDAVAGRVPVVVSVRDILVTKDRPHRQEEAVALCNRYDLYVLVHGDPDFVAFEATCPAAAALRRPVRYTGYVAAPDAAPAALGVDRTRADEAGEVVVSAGGGRVGGRLFRAALHARPLTRLADRHWRLVVGPNLPECEHAALRCAADGDVTVERFRPDLPQFFATAAVSISQAGYNTAVDLIGARARAVLVPFADGGENEQPRRAALMAAAGLAQVVPLGADGAPDAGELAAAIDRAAEAPRPPAARIRLDGARTTATIVAALARGRLTISCR